MHEMSIAVELLARAEEIAAEHNLRRIRSLTVRAGALRGIVPEALELAFSEAAQGTVAAGASLTVQTAPARVRCRRCGTSFAPTVDSFLCPRCNQADVEILQGQEILLLSVEGTSADEH